MLNKLRSTSEGSAETSFHLSHSRQPRLGARQETLRVEGAHEEAAPRAQRLDARHQRDDSQEYEGAPEGSDLHGEAAQGLHLVGPRERVERDLEHHEGEEAAAERSQGRRVHQRQRTGQQQEHELDEHGEDGEGDEEGDAALLALVAGRPDDHHPDADEQGEDVGVEEGGREDGPDWG